MEINVLDLSNIIHLNGNSWHEWVNLTNLSDGKFPFEIRFKLTPYAAGG